MIKDIFESNSRKEIIKRFLIQYSKGGNELFCTISSDYTNGINALEKAIAEVQINKKISKTQEDTLP